jgi:hypothetical protein
MLAALDLASWQTLYRFRDRNTDQDFSISPKQLRRRFPIDKSP